MKRKTLCERAFQGGGKALSMQRGKREKEGEGEGEGNVQEAKEEVLNSPCGIDEDFPTCQNIAGIGNPREM